MTEPTNTPAKRFTLLDEIDRQFPSLRIESTLKSIVSKNTEIGLHSPEDHDLLSEFDAEKSITTDEHINDDGRYEERKLTAQLFAHQSASRALSHIEKDNFASSLVDVYNAAFFHGVATILEMVIDDVKRELLITKINNSRSNGSKNGEQARSKFKNALVKLLDSKFAGKRAGSLDSLLYDSEARHGIAELLELHKDKLPAKQKYQHLPKIENLAASVREWCIKDTEFRQGLQAFIIKKI